MLQDLAINANLLLSAIWMFVARGATALRSPTLMSLNEVLWTDETGYKPCFRHRCIPVRLCGPGMPLCNQCMQPQRKNVQPSVWVQQMMRGQCTNAMI